jgi:hypothetical protein
MVLVVQITIVREDFAHECNIFRLLDKRFANKMVGVGSAMSLGRVHGVSRWLLRVRMYMHNGSRSVTMQ